MNFRGQTSVPNEAHTNRPAVTTIWAPDECQVMKRVEATIRPEKVSAVMSALSDIGCGISTISEVRRHGDELGVTRQWRGMTYLVDVLPKTRIELVVQEALVERVVSVIRENAATGAAGDGTIMVLPVENAIEVSTGRQV